MTAELVAMLAVGVSLLAAVITAFGLLMNAVHRLEARMEARFDRLEARFERLKAAVTDLCERVARIEGMLAAPWRRANGEPLPGDAAAAEAAG